MSLIPDRYECVVCGGYDLPWPTTLSSRCRCRDKPEPTTKGPKDAPTND